MKFPDLLKSRQPEGRGIVGAMSARALPRACAVAVAALAIMPSPWSGWSAHAQSAVEITRNSEIVPRDSGGNALLAVGDSFRILVVTNQAHIAGVGDSDNSKDIADHNGDIAEGVGVNALLAPHKDSFRALVSTTGDSSATPPIAAVDARDNTATTGTGVPIYWFKGSKLANDYRDFYDGGWGDHHPRDHNGEPSTSTTVWTGSRPNGTASDKPLGSSDVITFGVVTVRTTEIESGVSSFGDSRTGMYALSPVFEVIAATAPTVSSATVGGTVLRVFFSENLVAAPSLANSDFTVKKTPQGESEQTVALAGAPVTR